MLKRRARFLAPLVLAPALGAGSLLVLGGGASAAPGAVANHAPARAVITSGSALAVHGAPAPTAVAPLAAPGLDPRVLALAEEAASRARARGLADHPRTLSVIDYSLPSTEKRLWVFDLETRELLFHELVAHGMNTGANRATRFSNADESKQTSLGLFVANETYVGRNGYSLRLDGLDAGINDNARRRAIVVHGADYVSADFARRQGRIGRSWGCPALPVAVHRQIIDTMKGGNLLFAYYPDSALLERSEFLRDTAPASDVLASLAATGAGAVAAR